MLPSPKHDGTTKPKGLGAHGKQAEDFFNKQKAQLEKKSCFRRVQDMCRMFVDSYTFQAFMILNLFFVIFLLDLCVILNVPSSFDPWAIGFLYFAFVAFTIEMILRELSNSRYILSSFFVMDFIGTIAILIDIPFFQETIFGIDTDSTEDYQSNAIFKTSRATRLGSRAGQILKVVRLLRVVRVARLLRLVVKVGRHRFNDSRSSSILAIKEESGTKETTTLAIGERLNDIIAQRVAALVMISIFIVPLLIYETPDSSKEVFLLHLDFLGNDNNIDNSTAHELADNFFSFFSVNGLVIPLNLSLTTATRDYEFDWRTSAVLPVRDDSYYTLTVGNATAVFNTYPKDLHMSWLDVTLVLFVVTVLTFFSGTLAGSCKKLVVDPLNNMLKVVHKNTAELVDAFNNTEKLETEVLSNIISKMTKVVVAKGQGGEKSKVQAFMNDNQMDETTRNFLAVNYTKVRLAQRRNNGPGSIVKHATKRLLKLRKRSPAEETQLVEMQVFDSWDYNVFDYSIPELREHVKTVLGYMFAQLKQDSPPSEPVLSTFVQEIEKRYMHKENPYHNFYHGVDVMWTCYRFLTVTDADTFISKEEQLALILAAYCHDVGHVGVTNKFLTDTNHALALRYNDKAVQENYHSASLFEALMNNNVLEGVDSEKFKVMRLVMVETVRQLPYTYLSTSVTPPTDSCYGYDCALQNGFRRSFASRARRKRRHALYDGRGG